MKIRTVKTASGKYAVQVVSKRFGKVTVHKHIGSYQTEAKKSELIKQAQLFMQKTTGQQSLFDSLSPDNFSDIIITESKPLLVYQILSSVYDKLGFSSYSDPLVKDLVIARIYQPVSKRETRDILADTFDRGYSLITVYRHLKTAIEKGLKDTYQQALIQFARQELNDVLKLVFYDVTTLYFESAAKRGIKDFGFSKDHRASEVQIVLGLVVNGQGFPLYFDVFSGKTFEGHTFKAIVEEVKKILNNPELVIIADAAMLSQDNLDYLAEKEIGFIVGARIANLPYALIDEISAAVKGQDDKITTVAYQLKRLICQYSAKRAVKDKADREKQIKRAEKAVSSPSKVTGRYRFLKTKKKTMSVNEELITKAEKLEGIKGYMTNTDLPELTIIDRYHDLWRIENAFRITKSDLEARPIFLHLDETIKAHVVIVFAGLAICRYIEIKTGMSIKKALSLAGKVLTHKLINQKTGAISYKETKITDEDLCGKLELLKSLGH